MNTRISIFQLLLLTLLLFPGVAAATHSREAATFGDGVSKSRLHEMPWRPEGG